MEQAQEFIHSAFKGIIGICRKDITPPVGIFTGNWGAAKRNIATGIHLPLTLTCITFQASKFDKPLVLIAADLGWWKNADDEKELRNGILNGLSLNHGRLLFCLSHTHSGPGLSAEDSEKPGGELIKPYLKYLQNQSIAAAKSALDNASEAVLTWSYGTCGLAANRDLEDTKNGRFVVGYNPAPVADNTLLVGRITDLSGKIISTIVNYACHPTTLAWENELISPDYVGAMRNLVEKQTNAPCAFLQGASGDLSPKEQFTGNTNLADRYGRELGYAVLSVLEGILTARKKLSFDKFVESGAPLALWKEEDENTDTTLHCEVVEISFPLKSLPSLQALKNDLEACSDPVQKERLRRKIGVRKSVGDGEKAMVPLVIWKLGSSLILGQPNEAYSQFQTELRLQFQNNALCVINVANGHIGYLPPSAFYNKDIYSVWQTPFAQGSLEKLTRGAIDAVKILL